MNQWDDPEVDQLITNKDLYQVLGVARDASESQIKRAYHKLAMVHHPDKRASNPTGSDESFKEISYAYKVLSDADKRAIYDTGGAEALEEQEGMANLNIDQLLLNILMWEAGQKIFLLLGLLLILLEAVLIPILSALRLDGVLSWSWFAVSAPLWIPMGLALPLLVFAPIGVYVQYNAAKNDTQLISQARATCMGCLATTVFLGCIAGSAGMLCSKLDGMAVATWSFQQAMIPLYVFEGLLLLTYIGAALRVALEGLFWKFLRVTFVVLLALRLDGVSVWWIAVLTPLIAWVVCSLGMVGYDVYVHRMLKEKSSAKDVTMEEEASRYAPFLYALRAVLLVGAGLSILLVCARLSLDADVSYLQSMGAVVVSSLAGYGMVAWALLCFRPAGLDGGADYSACDSASESYGTFQGATFTDSEYP